MPSAIGPFTFADLSAPPQLVRPQVIARTRPGANGVMMQALGVKAPPFEVESDAKTLSFTAALNQYIAYRFLVGGASVLVTWADHPFFLTGHRFFVMDVECLSVRSVINGLGPFGPYNAELICRWKLQPVTLNNQ